MFFAILLPTLGVADPGSSNPAIGVSSFKCYYSLICTCFGNLIFSNISVPRLSGVGGDLDFKGFRVLGFRILV